MKKSLHLRFMSAAMLMGFACAASAANQTVTDAAGLKAAIEQAQDGDVITIDGTITMAEPIAIKGKTGLTIKGGTLDGDNKTLIFNISGKSQVTIEDMVFQNAFHQGEKAGEEKGGAIRVEGGSLTINDCEFVNNHVSYNMLSDNGYPANWNGGGAIHATDVELNVKNTLFENNSGHHGGALTFWNSYGTFEECVFKGNDAKLPEDLINGTDTHGGGAVFVRWDNGTPKTFKFLNCAFTENSAPRMGGALEFMTGADSSTKDYKNNKLIVQGCSFVGNKTLTTEITERGRGGAIELSAERALTVDILASTFANNITRNNGGAIDLNAAEKEGHYVRLNIVNCTITGNKITNDGGGNGGGIYLQRLPKMGDTQVTEVNVINTIIAGNKGVLSGAETNSDFRIQNGNTPYGECIKNLRNCLIRDLNQRENLEVYDINYEGTKCGNGDGFDFGVTAGLLDPDALFGEMVDDSYFPLKADCYAVTNKMSDADALAAEFGLTTDQLGQTLNRNLIGAVSLLEGETPGTTGIKEVVTEEMENTDDSYYTIGGVRVSKPSKPGIYIHKGKKFVVR